MKITYSKYAEERPDLLEQYKDRRNANLAVVEAFGALLDATSVTVENYNGDRFSLALPAPGESLGIYFAGYGPQRGKMNICGRYQKDTPASVYISRCAPDSIGCSPNKAPKLIAADITRKLLPGYRYNLKAVGEKVAAMQNAADLRDLVTASLAKAFGGKPHAPGGDSKPPFGREATLVLPLQNMDKSAYGNFKISPAGYITLDVRGISEQDALAIAKILCNKKGG